MPKIESSAKRVVQEPVKFLKVSMVFNRMKLAVKCIMRVARTSVSKLIFSCWSKVDGEIQLHWNYSQKNLSKRHLSTLLGLVQFGGY